MPIPDGYKIGYNLVRGTRADGIYFYYSDEKRVAITALRHYNTGERIQGTNVRYYLRKVLYNE